MQVCKHVSVDDCNHFHDDFRSKTSPSILYSGTMDVQSEIINKQLPIKISESIDISKANIDSVCVLNANDSQSNNDLEALMNIVPFLVPILFSIIIITGFFGNILVVCVVTRNKNMRNTTNLLIINLAVSFNKHIHLFESNLNLKLIKN